jgi:hypothetical protein
MLAIVGWGSSSCVQSIVEKFRENNQKAEKTNRTINQTPTFKQEHNKI